MNNVPENAVLEEVKTEAAEVCEEQFFPYSIEYAKKKRTYSQPAIKVSMVWITISLAVLLYVAFVLVVPNASETLSLIALGVAALIILFGIFVVPVFHNYKIKAIYRAFITDGEKLWKLEYKPYKAMAGSGVAGAAQAKYNEFCFAASQDKETAAAVVKSVNEGKGVKNTPNFKSVHTVCMSDVKVVKMGKNAQCTYVDAKGKTRKIKIADCHPNLFEYINK